MRLENRVALVTGGSRSIGRAIALAFAREGADVAVNYTAHPEAAEAVVAEIERLGRSVLAVQADVSSREQVEAMVERVMEAFGRIDILVNNAGILQRTPLLEITEDEWDRTIDINLKGTFLCSQVVARRMAEQARGVIVNLSSAGARRATPNLAHYNTSKGAITTLTQQLALELAPFGIRANAIAPGMVETDLNRDDLADPAFRAQRVAKIPLGIIGTPDDVAAAAVFLASDDSRLMTGAVLALDGGNTIG
jgi:3-oxoacyl-[acyl-carrier protein] reductase